jgi:hypothetical protein
MPLATYQSRQGRLLGAEPRDRLSLRSDPTTAATKTGVTAALSPLARQAFHGRPADPLRDENRVRARATPPRVVDTPAEGATPRRPRQNVGPLEPFSQLCHRHGGFTHQPLANPEPSAVLLLLSKSDTLETSRSARFLSEKSSKAALPLAREAVAERIVTLLLEFASRPRGVPGVG